MGKTCTGIDWEQFIYDPNAGNLDSKARVVFGYGDPAHPHAVTRVDGVLSFTWDANGNQVGRGEAA